MSFDIVPILTAGATAVTFAMAFVLISRYVRKQGLTLRE